MATIVPVRSPEQLSAVRGLFAEYVAWLGIDLSYQNFATEFAELPWHYAPPRGELLLALEDGGAAGCVAVKPIEGDACEFKRFFVRPSFRGRGLGLALGRAIVSEARRIGYRRMRLDTLPSMKAAVAVYVSLGFKPIEAYHPTPVPGTIFMELDLRDSGNGGIRRRERVC